MLTFDDSDSGVLVKEWNMGVLQNWIWIKLYLAWFKSSESSNRLLECISESRHLLFFSVIRKLGIIRYEDMITRLIKYSQNVNSIHIWV